LILVASKSNLRKGYILSGPGSFQYSSITSGDAVLTEEDYTFIEEKFPLLVDVARARGVLHPHFTETVMKIY